MSHNFAIVLLPTHCARRRCAHSSHVVHTAFLHFFSPPPSLYPLPQLADRHEHASSHSCLSPPLGQQRFFGSGPPCLLNASLSLNSTTSVYPVRP